MKSLDKYRSVEPCYICGSTAFISSTVHFLRCTYCRHETAKIKPAVDFIVNDTLSLEEIKRIGLLDKFKLRVTKKSMEENDLLVDIGSASGKFLYHSRCLFKDHAGVEVTDECVKFSRDLIGLNIHDDISNIKWASEISMVTFWHSLEHIPFNKIEYIFGIIKPILSLKAKIIISVPNSGSLMFSLFKKRFPYYDLSSHYHQFSSVSLDLLMLKYGFLRESYHFSIAYTVFGYLQGFLNYFNRFHNFIYYYKKRGVTFGLETGFLRLLYLYNLLLSCIFFVPSLVLCVFDVVYKKKGGVITACYRRKKE